MGGGSDLLVHTSRAVEVAINTRHAGIGYVREEADAYVIGGAALLREVEHYLGPVANGMRADDMPKMTRILVEAEGPAGLFGTKNVAEIAIYGPAPAISNATHDAIGI